MLQSFKRFVLVAALALLSQTMFGFSLLGPRDTWQTSNLGYDPLGDGQDLGGPKNLGEEWRWNIPTITYAFSESFINFFGTNGIAAIDQAAFLFNRELTNSLQNLTDAQLRAKPLNAKRINLTAQSLGLLDLKSEAMGLMAEQLGLAGSERWVWTIRARQVINNITNYLIIKRNFDPFTLQPSSYVNGQRLTYAIQPFPAARFGGADFEDAVEAPLDQTQILGTTVSTEIGANFTGFRLREGEYFTSLSQDDIGGLRYIYRANNVNTESLTPSVRDLAGQGPTIRFVDTNQLVFIPGIDAFTFFTNAFLTPPGTLLTQFTNLNILQTNVSITNIVSTTFTITNITASGLFTNTSLPTLISNSDLFTFSEDSRTNRADLLRAIYPQLIITKTNSSFVTEVDPFFYLTNSPYGTPTDPLIIATNYITNLVVNYKYEYANVITNYASAFTDMQIQDIHRAPYSTPGTLILATNFTTVRTNIPSGGFFILDRSTNADLVAYSFNDENGVPLTRTTNVFDIINSGYIITNAFDPTDVRIHLEVNKFTNVVYAAYPVMLNEPIGQQIVSVTTTNFAIRYDYVFDTNTFIIVPPSNGNTNAILQTITFTNGNPISITQSNVFTEIPKGTILILDTNNFVLAGPRIETFGLVTNVISSFTNAATGEFITQLLIYQTNSVQFAAYPVVFVQPTTPILRPGVDTIKFVRQPAFDFLSGGSTSFSTNLYTINVVTNGISYVQTLRRVSGPDILFDAQDLGVTANAAVPVGVARTINFQLATGGAAAAQVDGGPGLIAPGSTITFSKLVPSFLNQTPGAVDEETSFQILAWGSFDSRTVVPIVYPQDITGQLQTLDQIVRHQNP